MAYRHTKEDMQAATRLDIWRELMRQHVVGADGRSKVRDPEEAMEAADRIFQRAYGKPAKKR